MQPGQLATVVASFRQPGSLSARERRREGERALTCMCLALSVADLREIEEDPVLDSRFSTDGASGGELMEDK
eukprot:COSAG03_NODE_6258_length_1088_cov_4594.301314_2_plen_72_part_00